MKKVFTLVLSMILVLSVTTSLDAQTPKTVLVELVTQASCPPCAGNNPITLGVVNDNDNAIMLAYQVWWPGFDPMFLDNVDEVVDRIPALNWTGDGYGAPTPFVNGTEGGGLALTQANIDNAASTPSEFELTLNTEVIDGILNVTGMITATMAASGDFRLRIALTEHLITIQDAPGGTNGETEYHNVFKRFLGGVEGIDLPDTWEVGDQFMINETQATHITNIYHADGMEIVGWIQNDNTKAIHQAAKSSDLEVTSNFSNSTVAISTAGLASAFCTGDNTVSPVFKLQNIGSTNLTSVAINYSVDGGTEQTVNWTGDLAVLETTEVTLDPITFNQLAGGSTLTITAANPNGVADDDMSANDAIASMLAPSPSTVNTVELEIVTDNFGGETYWQIANSAGDVIASGGNASVGLTNIGVGTGSPPADAGSYGDAITITETIDIPADDCYVFTITDFYGDGICCTYGNGSYTLRDASGEVLLSGASFNAREDASFEGFVVVGTEDVEFTSKFSVSPNPVLDFAQLEFTLEESEATTLTVVNGLGQVVSQTSLGKLAAGLHNESIDMSQLSAGVYMIHINSGSVSGTKKVIVGNRF